MAFRHVRTPNFQAAMQGHGKPRLPEVSEAARRDYEWTLAIAKTRRRLDNAAWERDRHKAFCGGLEIAPQPGWNIPLEDLRITRPKAGELTWSGTGVDKLRPQVKRPGNRWRSVPMTAAAVRAAHQLLNMVVERGRRRRMLPGLAEPLPDPASTPSRIRHVSSKSKRNAAAAASSKELQNATRARQQDTRAAGF